MDEASADAEVSDAQQQALEVVTARLDAPATPGDLYLDEASVFRPICTGDVFRRDSSSNPPALFILVNHPCAMRRGADLEPLLQVAPVEPRPNMRRTEWTPGVVDVMHLPCLLECAARNGHTIPNSPWAAQLRLCYVVPATDLDVEHRIACLSPRGIEIFLQRLVHTDTRAALSVALLRSQAQPALEELELWESWNEVVAGHSMASGTGLNEALVESGHQFDGLMASPLASGTVRDALASPDTRSAAIRCVNAAIGAKRST